MPIETLVTIATAEPPPENEHMLDPPTAADGAQSASTSAQQNTAAHPVPRTLAELPPYAKTLLNIKVPIEVTLATTQMPIREVVELVPGSIIQFDKPCDALLSMSVGDVQVAEGDAVKVGDKFGLRVTSLTLPSERFERLAVAAVRPGDSTGPPPG